MFRLPEVFRLLLLFRQGVFCRPLLRLSHRHLTSRYIGFSPSLSFRFSLFYSVRVHYPYLDGVFLLFFESERLVVFVLRRLLV